MEGGKGGHTKRGMQRMRSLEGGKRAQRRYQKGEWTEEEGTRVGSKREGGTKLEDDRT